MRAQLSDDMHERCSASRSLCITRGISLDLGAGGLGAIVQGELRVGDTVAIDLRLSERLLSIVAIVRHTSSVRSGFEFVGLTPQEQLLITSVVGSN
jgi:hypothetical protein